MPCLGRSSPTPIGGGNNSVDKVTFSIASDINSVIPWLSFQNILQFSYARKKRSITFTEYFKSRGYKRSLNNELYNFRNL